MLFVLGITLWALVRLVSSNLEASHGLDVPLLNAVTAAALIALAIYLASTALRRLVAARAVAS
jgi:hypothetical protein